MSSQKALQVSSPFLCLLFAAHHPFVDLQEANQKLISTAKLQEESNGKLANEVSLQLLALIRSNLQLNNPFVALAGYAR